MLGFRDLEDTLHVRTVLGDVDPQSVGITLPHEHIFIDLSCRWHESADPFLRKYSDDPIRIDNLWILHRDPYLIRDNLILSDMEVLARELEDFRSAGGSTIADLTCKGLNPKPDLLKEISLRSGLNVIAGCGYYVALSHPPDLGKKSIEDVASEIRSCVQDGIDNSTVRAGVIGEIGISSLDPNEEKVLRAAARAHNRTKAPINVHIEPYVKGYTQAERVLDILEEEGADLRSVILSHMDVVLDLEYESKKIAPRGPFIEYDDFGEEEYIDSIGFANPRDIDRVNALSELLDRGLVDQLLISQDVCLKMYTKSYGGPGYDHILRNIVPMMKRADVTEDEIRKLLVTNPARALSF